MGVRRAKALFQDFLGSHFQMQREGQYDVYKAFNISAAQESDWAREAERALISAIAGEADEVQVESLMSALGSWLSAYRSAYEFKELLDVLHLKLAMLDSFTVIRSCEEVLKIIDELQRAQEEPDLCGRAKELVRSALQGVLDSPIHVSPGYYTVEYLKGFLTEDKLLARANRDLARCDV